MVAEGVLLDGWDDGDSGGMAIVSVSVRYLWCQLAAAPTSSVSESAIGRYVGFSCSRHCINRNVAARLQICSLALFWITFLVFVEI